jgi:hypothetical protein
MIEIVDADFGDPGHGNRPGDRQPDRKKFVRNPGHR